MSQPTKQQVRAFLLDRVTKREPLPSQKDIRRRLGWGSVAVGQHKA